MGDGENLFRPQCGRANPNDENLIPMPQYGQKQVQMEDQNLTHGNYDYPVFTGIEQLQRDRLAQTENKGLVQIPTNNDSPPKKVSKKHHKKPDYFSQPEENQPKVQRHQTQANYQERNFVPEVDMSRVRGYSLQECNVQRIPIQKPAPVRINNPAGDQIKFISGTQKKSVHVLCPNCESEAQTQVRCKYKNLGRLITVALCTLGAGIFSTVPCCVPANWKYIHKCPKCKVTLSAIPGEDKWINN